MMDRKEKKRRERRKAKQKNQRKAKAARQAGQGTTRSIPMTPELRELLLQQRERFIEKFGREPGPDDKVFFEEEGLPKDEDEFADMLEEDLKTVGSKVDPALLYATRKTGRMVTEFNQHLLSEDELDEWNEAVEEYRALKGIGTPE